MQKSLLHIGSKEFYNQIIQDFNDLFASCFQHSLVPISLVVGRPFVEMSCCHSLVADFKLENWEKSCKDILEDISYLFYVRLKEVIKELDLTDGFIGEYNTIQLYFDPDEVYMCMYVVDPSSAASKEDTKTKDGYKILKLKYKKEEYDPDLLH